MQAAANAYVRWRVAILACQEAIYLSTKNGFHFLAHYFHVEPMHPNGLVHLTFFNAEQVIAATKRAKALTTRIAGAVRDGRQLTLKASCLQDLFEQDTVMLRLAPEPCRALFNQQVVEPQLAASLYAMGRLQTAQMPCFAEAHRASLVKRASGLHVVLCVSISYGTQSDAHCGAPTMVFPTEPLVDTGAVRQILSERKVPLAGAWSKQTATRAKKDLAYIKATCRHCTATPAKLLKCSSCRLAHYYNSTCQKADWEQHKQACQIDRMKLDAAKQVRDRQKFK